VAAEECENFCDLPTGHCDAAPVHAMPFNWELDSEPTMLVDGFAIDSSTLNLSVSPDETGLVSFPLVGWTETIRYEWWREQLEPIHLLGGNTRVTWETSFPQSSADPIRVPYLFKSTAGRIAYECGLFESLEEATGELADAVPTELSSRGVLLVELGRDASSPAPVDRSQISFELQGWEMTHGSEDPEGLLAPFVCDVVSDQGLRLGAPDSNEVGSEGWFFIFGLRATTGTSYGQGSLTVPGYEVGKFSTSSYGETAYLRLTPG
jgi:hypothetical protein